MRIEFPKATSQLKEGDSVALDGVCTTAIQIDGSGFSIQLLQETLKKTTLGQLSAGHVVNWELSATPITALGGHIVYGHVDEVGILRSLQFNGEFAILSIEYSPQYRPFLIPKGSICINGTSLTVVDVHESTFSCHLIPHTIKSTSLEFKKPGNSVNLEYDIVAKYLYNFTQLTPGTSSESFLNTLNKAGFYDIL